MQQKSLESVSAMMDGEIEAFELRRLVERASSDDEVAAKWQRYHLAQDLLKGRDVSVNLAFDLSASVRQAIEQEPAFALPNKTEKPTVDRKNASPTWFKPFASMAVAASVTAVVILGGQQFNQQAIDPILF